MTQRSIALTSLQGLYRNQDAVGRLQQQLTAGRTISRPSDSPTGTNQSMIIRADASGAAQYARNIADGSAFLETTDSTLQSMLQQTRQARSLVVQAASTGGMSTSSAGAIRTELEGLRTSLLGLANAVVQGRPVFGGPTGGTVAYADDGTFVGRTDGVLTRRVSDREDIRIDVTGPEAFGTGPTGLFAVLERAAAAAGAQDATALQTALDDLDGVMERMLTATADIGTRAARMDRAAEANTDLQLSLKQQLAGVEDVDLPKTIMELNLQQVGYQVALQATAQVIQPSLAEFLR
ncbi:MULTISPECIES: flagellin N-terminal helical domain-containing protein [Geodermatophilus]|uniref:Flagellin n=1 Tax=Geodermatophilus arenarius TaxID=1137990 RepID=A0ABV9LS37_9ACTN